MNIQLEYWQQQNLKLPLEQTSLHFRRCWICGKQYDGIKGVSSHLRQIHQINYIQYFNRFYKTFSDGQCLVCTKPTIWTKGKYNLYCSCQCSNLDENVQNKIREKNKQNSQISIQKRKQTSLQKYGVEHFCQTTKFKSEASHRLKNSSYGFNNPETLQQILNTQRQKIYNNIYGKLTQLENIQPNFTLEEYHGTKNRTYSWLCKKCNKLFDDQYVHGVLPRCPVCFPKNYLLQSNELRDYLISKNIFFEQNNRQILQPYELDFYCPNERIAIEYNGLYWHSEVSGGKDNNYHFQKTESCLQKNIQLIHIFEDEWINKQQIVKNRLKYLFQLVHRKIYARKCMIRPITTHIKNKFLDKYHLQGKDQAKISLGCFYKNRLIAVMTFGKLRISLGRKHQEDIWELSRYATIANFSIIGGAGKLLKFFEKTYNPKQIITYSDRRWGVGNLYNQIGFSFDHKSSPNYWYFKKSAQIYQRFHRFNFRKSILHKKLDTFDNSLTEWENMKNNKYDRIWDSGNDVFIKTYERKSNETKIN
jgi:very-short-patch-repair endonuclease